MAELEVHFPDGLVGFKPIKPESSLVIGNGQNADIQINRPRVAPEHCIIRWERNAFKAEVVGKGRNVRLNGTPIVSAFLKPNDELTVAEHRFVLRAADDEAIYDDMDFQFDVDAVKSVESQGESLRTGKGKSKPVKEYYVPLYRSPLFLAVSGAFAVLCVIGLSLFLWVRSASAGKQYDAAMEDVNNGLYASAIRRFDRFLESYSTGELAEQAVVWRGIARVRQFADGSVGDWENALRAVDQLYEESGELDFYRERGKDVFDLFQKTALGLANKARENADGELAELAKDALALSERAVASEHIDRGAVSAIQAAIGEADFVVAKERYRQDVLQRMDQAIAEKDPISVYRLHQSLYGRYPDLAADADSSQRRETARKLDAQAVEYAPIEGRLGNASQTPPAPSWAIAYRTGDESLEPSDQRHLVQVHDAVYALDTGTGAAMWRSPVGYSPAFAPMFVPGDANRILVHRSADGSLALLDATTGEPVWTASLGDRAPLFGSQPIVRRGQIFLFVVKADEPRKGRMLLVRLQSGAPIGEYVFPQPLVGSPALDSRRDSVLAMGERSSLYDVNLTEEACKQAIAIEHEPGAVQAAPLLAGRFLFLAENLNPDKSRLHCYVIPQRDGDVRQRQHFDLSGAVWKSPAVGGGRLFVTTDRERLYVFELGSETDLKPMSPLLFPPESRDAASVQPFALPLSERECWTAGRKLERYRFRMGEAPAGSAWETDLPGIAFAPPVASQDRVIVTSTNPADGQTVVACYDGEQQRLWSVRLGRRPEAIRTDPNRPEIIQWYDPAGLRELTLSDIASEAVFAMDDKLDENGDRERFVTLRTLHEWQDGVVQWGGIGQNRLMYFPEGGGGRETILPGLLSGKPAVFHDGLLAPCEDGFLYWVDPKSGKELAEPFMGPYREGRPSSLRSVTAVDEQTVILVADQSILRLRLQEEPFRRLESVADVELDDRSSGQLITLEDRLFMVRGNQLYSLHPESLEILDRWSLDADVNRPPVRLGKNVLFITDEDELICFGGPRGQVDILWRRKLDAPPVGAPLIEEDRFWIALADGRVIEHSIDEDVVLSEQTAGWAVIDGPWPLEQSLAVLNADGSVAVISRNPQR